MGGIERSAIFEWRKEKRKDKKVRRKREGGNDITKE